MWGPLWAGLGRAERGEAVAFVAAEHAAGSPVPRVTAGLTTWNGAVTPTLGVGLDVFPVRAVGVGLAVEQPLAGQTAVRLGLRVRPDLVDPEGTRPLFQDGTAAARWRAALGYAIGGDAATSVPSLSLERTVRGALSAGARVLTYTEGGVSEDGGARGGGAVEAFAAAGTAGRWVDLRALAGAGLSVLDQGGSPLVPGSRGERRVRPFLTGGLGLDVYPFPGVGFGVEGRLALASGGLGLSEVGAGLRVRLR
jgi:hypothetical protein